jgi:transcription factor CP2-like protein
MFFLYTDIPLSYGLVDVVVDSNRLNSIDFIWDPTKETGIYVKVNSISTEFTAKKHGGEKGVPFRLQIESKDSDNESSKLVHCASCQIKVFKVSSTF